MITFTNTYKMTFLPLLFFYLIKSNQYCHYMRNMPKYKITIFTLGLKQQFVYKALQV